jgi:hypothetical protein
MKTVPLRFVADMNISPLTVNVLAAEGMDIVRVSSLLPVNASDESILGPARQEGRTPWFLSAHFGLTTSVRPVGDFGLRIGQFFPSYVPPFSFYPLRPRVSA